MKLPPFPLKDIAGYVPARRRWIERWGLNDSPGRASSVQELYFDLIIGDGVEEGRLVCVNFNGRDVMYQIVNGLTRDEVVFQKATLGYVRAQARKVGSWDFTAHGKCYQDQNADMSGAWAGIRRRTSKIIRPCAFINFHSEAALLRCYAR